MDYVSIEEGVRGPFLEQLSAEKTIKWKAKIKVVQLFTSIKQPVLGVEGEKGMKQQQQAFKYRQLSTFSIYVGQCTAFLQLFDISQQMYCDFRMFNAYQALQSPQIVQPDPSQCFLHIISKAVAESFKQFSNQKLHQALTNARERPAPIQKAQNAPIAIIDLCSEQSEFEENFQAAIQVEGKALSARLHSSTGPVSDHQSPEINFSSPLDEQEKVQLWVPKQNQMVPEEILIANEGSEMDQEDYSINYQACCPKIGMESEEILRRKQSLMRRQVTNWDEIPLKGRKQRREIRMLQK